MSTCVGWPSGEILASTCVRIWTRPKPTLVNASQRKWMAKRNASRKLALTCADLRVRLASGLKEGKAVPTTKTRIVGDSRPWNSDWLIHSRWYLSPVNAVMQKSAFLCKGSWAFYLNYPQINGKSDHVVWTELQRVSSHCLPFWPTGVYSCHPQRFQSAVSAEQEKRWERLARDAGGSAQNSSAWSGKNRGRYKHSASDSSCILP